MMWNMSARTKSSLRARPRVEALEARENPASANVLSGTNLIQFVATSPAITVTSVADTPSVTNSATRFNTQTTTGLVISRNPADGPEVTHFKITGIIGGTLFQNDGTTPIVEGDFITFAQGNAGLKFTPLTGYVGYGRFTVQASTSNSDAGLGGGTASALIVVNTTTLLISPSPSTGTVVVKNEDGLMRFQLMPYSGVTGGIRTALGDFNGDGVDDIITGPAKNAPGHVKVFDGVTGVEIRSFFAFDPSFTGGITVASGDFNGDSVADIVVGAGAGGGPHVKVFDGATGAEIRSFFAYVPNYAGGVNVAAGDIDGDSLDDIITGSAITVSHVKVFNGVDNSELRSFFAYGQATNGVEVAVTTIAGVDTLITGNGPGEPSYVKVWEPNVRLFAPYAADFTGGVRLAGNAIGQIITATGPGGGPHIKIFDGVTLAELDSFFATDPSQTSGVYVG
jgi:hypothetical protein